MFFNDKLPKYLLKRNIREEENIFFLKKFSHDGDGLNKIYWRTALKYTKVDIEDKAAIYSGTFLSAIFVYIISEKFGIELVESNDVFISIVYFIIILVLCRYYFVRVLELNKLSRYTNNVIFYIKFIIKFFILNKIKKFKIYTYFRK